MPYHSHILNSNHSHIIGRTDPITGDSVQENDSVVFCTNCQSCVLEESWVYMNERHCEQNQTLDAVPALPSKLIAKKTKEEIIAELRNEELNFTIIFSLTISTFFISVFSLSNSAFSFLLNTTAVFIISLFITLLVGFVSTLIAIFTTSTKNDIRIFKDRIEIGKEIFYWKDIKQINFQREMEYIRENPASKTPTLFIYFHDQTYHKRNLPTKDYATIELFLKGLANISKATRVFLYSEQSQEYIVIKKIKENTKGDIIVGEPFKLLTDSTYPNQF